MESTLRRDHPLFRALAEDPPRWWRNLTRDPHTWVDVRRGNHVQVYCQGGSIMRLGWRDGFEADVSLAYVPLEANRTRLRYRFDEGHISLETPRVADLDEFSPEVMAHIKRRIRAQHPRSSESRLQARYVTRSLRAKRRVGFFIDTEFEFEGLRIDLVWVDFRGRRIVFVELKRRADPRLFASAVEGGATVVEQLEQYGRLIETHADAFRSHFDLVYWIKKDLKLLPGFSRHGSLRGFEVVPKPVLLIGDAPAEWAEQWEATLRERVREVAHGCVVHGPQQYGFRVPEESGAALPTIASTFSQTFAAWGIALPDADVAARRRGKIVEAGWAIWYLFGEDEDGEYLDYYAAHRMTNDGHVRLYESGRMEGLPAMPDVRPASEDPVEDARLEAQYRAEVQAVARLLEEKGFSVTGDEPGGVQVQRWQRLDGE